MKKIIIGDRDQELVKSLELFLKEYYQIITVRNDVELFEIISNEEVDLVLSDLKISTSCSLSTFKQIKNINPALPLILMYVYFEDAKELENSLKNVVDAIIHKPFDIEIVKVLIDNLIERKSKIYNPE